MPKDNLSAPLLRMASVFLGETLPKVNTVRDVYEYARQLRDRGIAPTPSEELLLKQVVWSLLQFQDHETDDLLHKALARLAGLVLAIIEDDDLSIPDDRHIGGRVDLGTLAANLKREHEQAARRVAASPQARAVSVANAASVDALARTLGPDVDKYLRHALQGSALHLREGEGILAKHTDATRRERHRQRYTEACDRTKHLLARLIAVPADQDAGVVRGNLVRRELKRIEIDALGAERLTEVEQVEKASKLLAWIGVDLGEAATEGNRARLSAELRAAASEPAVAHGEDDGAWLFNED